MDFFERLLDFFRMLDINWHALSFIVNASDNNILNLDKSLKHKNIPYFSKVLNESLYMCIPGNEDDLLSSLNKKFRYTILFNE